MLVGSLGMEKVLWELDDDVCLLHIDTHSFLSVQMNTWFTKCESPSLPAYACQASETFIVLSLRTRT